MEERPTREKISRWGRFLSEGHRIDTDWIRQKGSLYSIRTRPGTMRTIKTFLIALASLWVAFPGQTDLITRFSADPTMVTLLSAVSIALFSAGIQALRIERVISIEKDSVVVLIRSIGFREDARIRIDEIERIFLTQACVVALKDGTRLQVFDYDPKSQSELAFAQTVATELQSIVERFVTTSSPTRKAG